MDRQEYLKKMQSYREELQNNATQNRKALDDLNDKYRQDIENLNREKRNNERKIRDEHTENQHRIEKLMHELKVQWAKEHPVDEVKVVE